VSWLRRTEYLSSEAGNKVTAPLAASKAANEEPEEEMTRERRILGIQATFNTVKEDLAVLKHPTKPHLKAVEAFELLPDEELYANTMSLVRFGEDPGEGRVRLMSPDAVAGPR
jgi:RNA polymerase II-associated factor 1